jgi:hypothetical protein
MCRFLAKHSEKTAQFHHRSHQKCRKMPNLRFQTDYQDTPLPQPRLAEILRLTKRAVFAVSRAV